MTGSSCRLCGAPLEHVFADLGLSPLANAYISREQLQAMQPFYPLCALVCGQCFLVQLEEHQSPAEIFSDYKYLSSYSTTWLEHVERYADEMVERYGLGPGSTVVEVGSNDGHLLRHFRDAGANVLGVEPAANVAAIAESRGVPTTARFFGLETANDLRETHLADLLLGNNVLAHVPDLNDFIAGLARLLAPTGVLTMEFPHLMRLVDDVQFDTIYHEHFSYFSFTTARQAFERHGLVLFDVEELSTHGGSLRIYARHREDASKPVGGRVVELLAREEAAGYGTLETYLRFAERVKEEKRAIVSFFVDAKRRGLSIAAYGAPAKGNTLLNYCGIGTDFIDYTVDRNPEKQGHFLPGTRIPILSPDEIERTRPDYLFVLPWNIGAEVMEQMRVIRDWGGRFVLRSPELTVVE